MKHKLPILVAVVLLVLTQTFASPQKNPEREIAQVRIEKQIKEAAQGTSSLNNGRSWFFAIAYPKDQQEYNSLRSSALLMVSAFATKENDVLIKHVSLLKGDKGLILQNLQTIKNELPQEGQVKSLFGGNRTDYIYLLPFWYWLGGGKLKVEFEQGGSSEIELPFPADLAFNPSPIPSGPAVSTDENVNALRTIANREFPNIHFTPRVRISSKDAHDLLVKKIDPSYPTYARAAGIKGTVIFTVIIGKDGQVKEAKVVSGPPELVDAAQQALMQWKYRQFDLKGEAVEIETQISIKFQ